MRRYFAIFFLLLFTIYQVGYISVYWLATHQINEYWNNVIPEDANLQKVSIPMTLPYWANQEEYTPTSGVLKIEGKIYRVVQKKYANDSLHLMMVEDLLTAHLNQSIKDWIDTSNGSDDQKSKANYLKSVYKDYPQPEINDTFLKRYGDYQTQSTTGYTFSIISFIAELDPFPPQTYSHT